MEVCPQPKEKDIDCWSGSNNGVDACISFMEMALAEELQSLLFL